MTEPSPNVPSTARPIPESVRAPQVFISYAHDSDTHRELVRDLWVFLCANGVDARIDRVAVEQRQDWALWMEQQVTEADRILIVASPAYKRRAGYDADPAVGRGVQWEARLIRDLYYRNQSDRSRFLPIVLPGGSIDDVPGFLTPATSTVYGVSDFSVAGAEALLRVIHHRPGEGPPVTVSQPFISPPIARSYLPALLASFFSAGQESPGRYDFNAAVMFADISGFTALAEQLAQRGSAGAEQLSALINRSFERLLSIIAAHDGHAVAFAGDALLAVWSGEVDGLAVAVRRAEACGRMVQAGLHDLRKREEASVSLRIGIGAGRVAALRVGGTNGRWYLLICGPSLDQAGFAQRRAGRDGVSLSSEASGIAGNSGQDDRLSDNGMRLPGAAVPPPRPVRDIDQEIGAAVQAYVPNAVRAAVAAGRGEWLAELRAVTPLFVNLAAIDALGADVLDSVQAIAGTIGPIVHAHGGALHQVIVDDKGLSLVSVFGLPPLAHEDDAARAARAAMVIRDAVQEMEPNFGIGVASGRAFCGVVGSDIRREYAVVGDVMNVAARLAQRARGSILCDDRTAESARSRVSFRPRGSATLKGRAAAVSIWTPIAPSQPIVNADAIVGRTVEREHLLSRLSALKNVSGGVLTIEGEPGIGKSSLLADLLQRAQAEGITALAGGGDAIEHSSPYHAWRPIVLHLLDAAAILDGRERRKHILELAGDDVELERFAPLLNDVLALDLPENALTRQLSGQVRADATRELLLHLLYRATRDAQGDPRPLLIVLDDAHWLDSVSWALARAAMMRIEPLLIVVAHRPLGEPISVDCRRLLAEPGVERLLLDRLPRDDALALVCQRLRVSKLPQRVAALIEARAQGNPFFSEQLARSLRDRGFIRITDGLCDLTPGARDFSAVSFPDTAHGVVAGRIDGLSPSHALTLKVASVIGLLFRSRVVREIHPIESDRPSVTDHLDSLDRGGFTVLAALAPDAAYTFAHAVTQEAAYGLLLDSQRRRLHRAVAEWYEDQHSDDLPSVAATLAHHWDRAGEPSNTLPFLELAGDQALRSGAYEEAVSFLTSAISLASRVHPPPEAGRQARWHRELADAFMGLGRLPDSREHAEHAVRLLDQPAPTTAVGLACDAIGQLLKQAMHRAFPARNRHRCVIAPAAALEAARAYERLTILHYFANARTAAIGTALRAVNLAERIEGSPELARGYALMCVGAGVVGLHPLARSYSQRARQISQTSDDLSARSRVLMATSLYAISVANWEDADKALAEGLSLSEHMLDQRSWGEFAFARAVVLCHRAEFAHLAPWSARMRQAADKSDDVQRSAHALMTDVWLCLPQGRFADALERLNAAIELLAGRHAEADEIHAYGILALARLRCGDRTGARSAGATAMGLISRSQPTTMYTLEGYACLAEMYLSLWAGGDVVAARSARKACAALTQLARVFPIARPRALLCAGMAAERSGNKRRAAAAWRRSLATAERLAMPYERARTHRSIGRSLAMDDPARDEHLSRACAIFADIGATHELATTRESMNRSSTTS